MHWHKEKDRIVVSVKRRHWYGVVAGVVLLWLVALGLIVWTLGQAGEMQRLREENELYARQAEMTAQRLTEMESRLAELDALDAEIRSLMSGTTAGRGDGGVISVAPTTAVSPSALLTRLGEVADRMETRRISLSLVRATLRDGTEVAWVPPLRAGAVNPDTPSMAPVRGGELTDPFGWRSDPFTGEQRFHEGIDLAAAYGTPIVATANGIVTRAEWVDGYGNLVEIQHVGGVITRYGHNSLVTVRVGDRVEAGQVVAFMGSTGRSTGSHVHYEVRINGVAVDPMLFIRPQRQVPNK